MDTFAYLHLIQDYEDSDRHQLQEPFGALKQIQLSNPTKLGLMGMLGGICSLAVSNPAQATEPFRASYAGGGYFYIFSGTCTSDCPPAEPINVNPPSPPACISDCPAPKPISVEPPPEVCTFDCPTVQPICTPDCPAPEPISVEPPPEVCTFDCPTVQPICTPDCPAPEPISVEPPPEVCTFDCPTVQPICTPDCPTGYTPISPPIVLKYGSVGAEVRALQIALRELECYHGPIDGVFGSSTHHAVLRFQRDHGLIPDGVVGSSTAQVLGLV